MAVDDEDYQYEQFVDAALERAARRKGKARPRDSKVDEAKAALLPFFPADGTDVYYGRQLDIRLEKSFFHWITQRALTELVEEKKINRQVKTTDGRTAHFYYPRRHRYPQRQIREIMDLISRFSEADFTRALGHHGEALVDAGFAFTGFRIRKRKVTSVGNLAWTRTNHDLDRLIERDGIQYGVEIKNTLGYIDQTEFQAKLAMCEFLGVRPLFVARMMPANYIQAVNRAGGFSLLFGNQHYPLLAEKLAREVRDRLGLPALVIRELPDTTMQRFERWHEKSLEREAPDEEPM